MGTQTPNHAFGKPTPGGDTDNWGTILNNQTIDKLEERVIIVDTAANRSNYTAYADALYLASDTGQFALGDGTNWVDQDVEPLDESVQDIVNALLSGGTGIALTYNDAGDDLSVAVDLTGVTINPAAVNATGNIDGDSINATGNIDGDTLKVDGNTVAQSVEATGQVALTSDTGVVDTGLSATDATFLLALGVDDPNADVKLSGTLFWDDSAGTYKVEITENIGGVDPTVNYDVIRVR